MNRMNRLTLWNNDNEMDNSKEFREFIQNLLLIRNRLTTLFCGSFFELPIQYVIANPTDMDIMHIPSDICALPINVSTPQNFKGKKFTIDTKNTHPGFARLHSPEYKRLYRRQASIVENHYRHGPAWRETLINLEHINLIDLISGFLGVSKRYKEIQRRLLELELDRVFAIYCPCWPTEADEWKTRERPNGWPPAEIVDKVVASGCYFVEKAHHSCPDDDTQWRFSFSQAEVILIHSWTDVQKYIYHLLRLIKSEVVKACGGSDGTIICTYFFKTLMFWECERKPQEFWEDKNVERSVSELLCIMIGWLIDGCVPNYFIPKSNMISALTERVDFTKEIHLLLVYATSGVAEMTSLWPRAYPKHMIGLVEIVLPEKLIVEVYLMLLRDNSLNPLYPKINTQILKHLNEKDSLFLRKSTDLYRGILSHLEFMTTCFPEQKTFLKRAALDHFIMSMVESDGKFSKRFLSIGESIYEFFQRIFTTARTQRRYSYYHQEESDSQNMITTDAKNNCLSTDFRRILQSFFPFVDKFVGFTTHAVSSAFLANFYYTALHDYTKTSAVCDTVFSSHGVIANGGNCGQERVFSLFITSKLSPIFDEYFQTVLGLIALCESVVSSVPDTSTVLVRICPAQLLKYLEIQCNKRRGVRNPEIDENFEFGHDFYEEFYTYESLSVVFMSAVLHASHFQS